MDAFQATAHWEVLKQNLNSGRRRINGETLVGILSALPNKQSEVFSLLYKHRIILSQVTVNYIPSRTILEGHNFIISKYLSSIATSISNKKLLLSNVDRTITLTAFTKLTTRNTMDFLLVEDYLRTIKQRRLPLYKHVKSQLALADIQPPTDYTKQEWKAITNLYHQSSSASTFTNGFISSQHHKFTVQNINYICSYESIIAIKYHKLVLIGAHYDYSPSTSKHLHTYLCTAGVATDRIVTNPGYIYLPLLKTLLGD